MQSDRLHQGRSYEELNKFLNYTVMQGRLQTEDDFSTWLMKLPPHVFLVAAFDWMGWSSSQIAARHGHSTLKVMAGEIITALKDRQDAGATLFREGVSGLPLDKPAAELLWTESSLKRLLARDRPKLLAGASILADYFEGYPPAPEADICEWIASAADVLVLARANAGAAKAWDDLRSRHQQQLDLRLRSHGRDGELLNREITRVWQLAARESYDPAKWSVARWLRSFADLLGGDVQTFEIALAEHESAMSQQVRGSRLLFREEDRQDAKQLACLLSWRNLEKFDPANYSLKQFFSSRADIAIRRTAENAGENPLGQTAEDDGCGGEIVDDSLANVRREVEERVMPMLVKVYARPRQEHARLAWGLRMFGMKPPRQVVTDFWNSSQMRLAGWLEDCLHTEYDVDRSTALGIFSPLRLRLRIKQIADKSFEHFAPTVKLEKRAGGKQRNGEVSLKVINLERANTVAGWVAYINKEIGNGGDAGA